MSSKETNQQEEKKKYKKLEQKCLGIIHKIKQLFHSVTMNL